MSQTRIAPLAFMFLFIISAAAAAADAAAADATEHTDRQHHNTNCAPGGASEHRPTGRSRTLKAATSSKSCRSRPPFMLNDLRVVSFRQGAATRRLFLPRTSWKRNRWRRSRAQPAFALHKCDPFEQITAVIALDNHLPPPPPTPNPQALEF